jgi:hypothetical protein
MSTRSLTFVIDTGYAKPAKLVCMYRHMDGYPAGHGQELFKFLSGGKVINGLGVGNPPKAWNGVGCLAAALVKHFKEGIGGVYLQPTNTVDSGQEYEYRIYGGADDGSPNLTVEVKYPRTRKHLFQGTVEAFGEWLKKPAIDEQ